MATNEQAIADAAGPPSGQQVLDALPEPVAKGATLVKDGLGYLGDLAKGDSDAIAGDVGGVAADAVDFVESAAGELGSLVSDPIGYLISAGLGFLLDLVTPLKQCVDLVTGDPEALGQGAERFGDLAKEIDELAQQLDELRREGLASWSGDAAVAAQQRLAEFADGVRGTAANAGHVATLLKASAMVMKVAEDVVKGILSDLVEQLVISFVAAQAAAVPTLGASEAAFAAEAPVVTAMSAARGASEVSKVARLVEKIEKVINKIEKFFGKQSMLTKFAGSGGLLGKGNDIRRRITEDGLGKTVRGEARDAVSKNLGAAVGFDTEKGELKPGAVVGKVKEFVAGASEAAGYRREHQSESDADIDRQLGR